MISPKVQKAAVITIVILLVLCSFFSGYGIYLKVTKKNVVTTPTKENTNKEKYFDGKLWFYDAKGNLIGTYACETSNCDIGKNVVNDVSYAIDYYQSGLEYLPVINEQYIFIKDNESKLSEEVFLFDIKNNIAYKTNKYMSVKNYGIGLENDLYIVENTSGKFGVLQIKANPFMALPYDYDFIGVTNNVSENNLLVSDYFVTLNSGYWNIVDKNQAVITSNIMSSIVNFNGEYIIAKNIANEYQLLDYNGNEKLSNSFAELFFTGKYLNCRTLDQEFYVYNISTGNRISQTHIVVEEDVIKTEMNEKKELEIYINEELAETVTLS